MPTAAKNLKLPSGEWWELSQPPQKRQRWLGRPACEAANLRVMERFGEKVRVAIVAKQGRCRWESDKTFEGESESGDFDKSVKPPLGE